MTTTGRRRRNEEQAVSRRRHVCGRPQMSVMATHRFEPGTTTDDRITSRRTRSQAERNNAWLRQVWHAHPSRERSGCERRNSTRRRLSESELWLSSTFGSVQNRMLVVSGAGEVAPRSTIRKRWRTHEPQSQRRRPSFRATEHGSGG